MNRIISGYSIRMAAVVSAAGILLSSCGGGMYGLKVKQRQATTIRETEEVETQFTGPKRRIGVVEFEDKSTYGKARGIGASASDILVTELVKSGKFIVVERGKLDKVMEEQKLGMTGAIDPNTAAQVGKMLGLQAIVVGAVSNFGYKKVGTDYLLTSSKKQIARATVDIRLIDAITGQVIFADSGQGEAMQKNRQFLGLGSRSGYAESIEGEALRAAIVKFVGNIINQVNKKPWSCRVADVDGRNIYIDAGLESGMEQGQKLDVIRLGREIKSPTTGLVIGRTEEPLGQAKIQSFFGEDGAIVKMLKSSSRMPASGDLVRLAN